MQDIQHIIDRLVGDGSEGLTFERVRGDIECARNKPLLIETDVMPISMTGYIIALQDVDLICTRRGMTVLRTQFVILHELGHMLLGHISRLTKEAPTCTYDEFIKHRNLKYAVHRSYTNMYTSPPERAAETLATALFEKILRDDNEHKHILPALFVELL
ncbi:MAG: hypothetical protein H0X37_21330 [Herpetosiphonaceae bacterium]|nr:hypothetical protein [Herpetosiphonaceae bacterium]